MTMAIAEHTNAKMTPIKLILSLLDNARFLIMHILTLGDAIKVRTVMGGSHLRLEETMKTARSTHKVGNSLFCDIYSSDVKYQPFNVVNHLVSRPTRSRRVSPTLTTMATPLSQLALYKEGRLQLAA